MKKLLLLLTLLFSTLSYSQDAFYNEKPDIKSMEQAILPKRKIYTNVSFEPKLGIGMMLGGATFVAAGLLATPVYEGGSTTIMKAWYSQPGFYPILGGATMFVVGIVVSFN